jgi:hypothetical protein
MQNTTVPIRLKIRVDIALQIVPTLIEFTLNPKLCLVPASPVSLRENYPSISVIQHP